MDKLQPLIRNRFWILIGLVIPLVLYGYYSANGSLKQATIERENALDGVKNGVSTGFEPNEDYIRKLSHINTFLDESVQDAIVDLWKKQQERMTWPRAVASRVPEEFMGEFDRQVPFIYKGLYPELIRRLQKRVQPVEPVDMSNTATNPMGLPMGGSGTPLPGRPQTPAPNQKVILAAMVPHAQFAQFGITSQEMWDAQIDIWMTELLFDAIVKINEDKENISDAVVRRIDLIELVGGSGEPVTKDAGAAGGGMDEEGMGRGGMMSGQAAIPKDVAFSPAEEFGSPIDAASGGGESDFEGMGGMAGAAGAAQKRYINETEDAPFLERGFYLSVIIQQTKIPDFITTLVNSDWPIQVRRFHVGENPYKQSQTGAINTTSQRGFESESGFGLGGMSGGLGSRGGFGLGSRPRERLSGTGRDPMASALTNIYDSNLPEYAMSALNHPDLVRLDVCGIITMYRQPKEILEAVAARKAATSNAPQEVEATPISDAEDPIVPEAVNPNAPSMEPGTPDGNVPAPEANPDADGTTPPAPDNPAVPETTPPESSS